MSAGKRRGGRGDESPPGVLGDETIEQNLNQEGHPEAKITRADVEAAFGDQPRREGEAETAREEHAGERRAVDPGHAGAKPKAARAGARRGAGKAKAKTGRKSGASRARAR
jgi:hypothetical protein